MTKQYKIVGCPKLELGKSITLDDIKLLQTDLNKLAEDGFVPGPLIGSGTMWVWTKDEEKSKVGFQNG